MNISRGVVCIHSPPLFLQVSPQQLQRRPRYAKRGPERDGHLLLRSSFSVLPFGSTLRAPLVTCEAKTIQTLFAVGFSFAWKFEESVFLQLFLQLRGRSAEAAAPQPRVLAVSPPRSRKTCPPRQSRVTVSKLAPSNANRRFLTLFLCAKSYCRTIEVQQRHERMFDLRVAVPPSTFCQNQ